MNKIFSIIRREYLTRVRKRTFIIMTLIGPLLFGGLMFTSYKMASMEDQGDKVIAVVEFDAGNMSVPDEELVFKDVIPSREHLRFDYLHDVDNTTVQHLLELSGYYGVLVLNHSILDERSCEVKLYSKKQPSIDVELYITQSLENFLFDRNLELINLSPEEIKSYKSNVKLVTSKLEKGGQFKDQKLVDLKRGIGYIGGFLVYFFIFFFGTQVMRGVIEEKTNRVIEVIITSVKPFQLMVGKIVGIALVGLTQFLGWIVLTLIIYQFSMLAFGGSQGMMNPEQMNMAPGMMAQEPAGIAESPALVEAISSIDVSFYLYLLGTFVFYFIFGYLLYASLFAAIGSAVDSETDTQQFILPITLPLILSIIVLVQAITNPEGQLVFWFSIIPFTSPVVMMARIPFNPPVIEIILSMGLLVLTFLAMTWLAGKIYRTGILMYGKKASYRELIKWIRYKD